MLTRPSKDRPLWTPPPQRLTQANITRFADEVCERTGRKSDGYADLHRWSVSEPAAFWSARWDFSGVIATSRGDTVVTDLDHQLTSSQLYELVWCHGNYVAIGERGGMIIYGRSDAVLNPGRVRIGTAAIYRQAEHIDEVVESLVIGQNWLDDMSASSCSSGCAMAWRSTRPWSSGSRPGYGKIRHRAPCR